MSLAVVLSPTLSAASASTQTLHAEVSQQLSTVLPIVRLSATTPLAANTLPALEVTPRLTTAWQQVSATAVQAVITGPITPSVTYRLSIPQSIACSSTCTFRSVQHVNVTSPTDYLWESQLLAELKYLPVSFTPSVVANSPTQQTTGTFTWLYPSLPSPLQSLWDPSTPNVVLKGALMAFQRVTNLPTTGVADSATWTALLHAVSTNSVDPNTYNYVSVSETYPETLRLYVGGTLTYTTLVNTGIPQAPTSFGTYPVYLRFTSQTMSGTNPDGTHYSDPGIPWISYFLGGEALHGYIRYHYGFPQSLGCVEMPFASAKTVWPYTPIGTLVSVNP